MARFTFLLPELTLNGGIRVVAQYGAELMAQGHRVQFIARRTPPPRLRDVLRGRARFSLGSEGRKDFFAGMEDHLKILPAGGPVRSADVPDADFLIATWWETVEWAMALPDSAGRRVHLMQGYEMMPWLDPARVAATYMAPTFKIAVSNWVARMVETNHGPRADAVIANAVDTDHFTFVPERDNPVLTLGFIYSAPPFKNSALVFTLKEHLAAQGVAARFVCFSAEEDVTPVTRHPDVAFHHKPSQTTIPALYQSCDLWLFPSLEEGFGLPILEAQSCGTPVISSMAGAGPDLMVTGVNGYLCGWDVAEFAAAVVQYAALDAGQQRAMRVAARRTAESHSWEMATRRLVAALGA